MFQNLKFNIKTRKTLTIRLTDYFSPIPGYRLDEKCIAKAMNIIMNIFCSSWDHWETLEGMLEP